MFGRVERAVEAILGFRVNVLLCIVVAQTVFHDILELFY